MDIQCVTINVTVSSVALFLSSKPALCVEPHWFSLFINLGEIKGKMCCKWPVPPSTVHWWIGQPVPSKLRAGQRLFVVEIMGHVTNGGHF